jgi:hypothetical protein
MTKMINLDILIGERNGVDDKIILKLIIITKDTGVQNVLM